MKTDIRDIIFWMLLGFTLIFIILRIIGIINSPDWIDLVPLATIVFAAGVAYGKVISSINMVYKRTSYLKKSFDNLSGKFDNLNNKFDILGGKLKNNEKRIVVLEKGQKDMIGLLRKR